MLGPIFVLKLKLSPKAFGRRLVAEMWLYPDGSRIVELSTKCLPGEGLDVAEHLLDFLASKDIPTDADQQTKTKTALEFFSAELHPRAASARAAPRRRTRATAAAANGAARGCDMSDTVDQVGAVLDEAFKEAIGIVAQEVGARRRGLRRRGGGRGLVDPPSPVRAGGRCRHRRDDLTINPGLCRSARSS